jgi:hypothetical protein
MQMAGLSMIAVGIIVDTKSTTYLTFFMSPARFNPVSISLFAVGALIFVVAFFGCCTASKACFHATVVVSRSIVGCFVYIIEHLLL